MMLQQRTTRHLFLSSLLFLGCASPEPPPSIDLKPQVDVEERTKNDDKTGSAYLQTLDKIAPSGSRKGEMTKDLRAYANFLMSIERRDKEQLDFHFSEIIKTSPSKRIASLAFGQWIKESVAFYTNTLPPKDIFVEDLLKRARDRGLQGFLTDGKLTDPSSIEREFPVVFRGLKFAPSTKATVLSERLSSFTAIDPPKTLNGLYTLSQKVCDADKSQDEVGFRRPLTPLRARLFYAHVLFCKNKPIESIHEYEIIANSTTKAAGAVYMRYVAWLQLAKLYKSFSRRNDVALAYTRLASLTVNSQTLANELEIDAVQANFQLADNLLWAGRNNALIGNYQDAEQFCRKAIEVLLGIERTPKLSSKIMQAAKQLRAEAYQTLATRISIEKEDMSGAISYLLIGFNVGNLSNEWQERFLWLLGLYHFVANEKAASLKYWDDLFARSRSSSEKSRLRFWIARAYADLGKVSESQEQMDKLAEEDPLSFYSVVAPRLANLKDSERWKNYFSSIRGKNLNLVEQKRFDLTDLRMQKGISDTLLRVEIAVASDLPKDILQALARDLQQQLPKVRKALDTDVYSLARIYLSRLQFAAGLYSQSFALSQEAMNGDKEFWQEWPDQIYILYPQPYQNIVKEHATAQGIDEDLIYAIARQESSFNATVESPAGAIGLMQLIPPTAQRLAKDLGRVFDPVQERLKEPEVNIQLGSAYLKLLQRYYKGNDPAVFGAYNAGEFAVDSWLARRKNKDPLLWIELIPFGETHTYVKHVWRNKEIYAFMREMQTHWAFEFAFAAAKQDK